MRSAGHEMRLQLAAIAEQAKLFRIGLLFESLQHPGELGHAQLQNILY